MAESPMDEDEWVELDESAMDECMVLATQLCTQPPQHQPEEGGQSSIQGLKSSPSKNGHTIKSVSDVCRTAAYNGCVSSVSDSGVGSTRNSSLNNPQLSFNSMTNQKSKLTKNNYMSRFSDFSASSSNLQQNLSICRKSAAGPTKGYNSLTMKESGSCANQAKDPVPAWSSKNEVDEKNFKLFKKAEEEKAKLDNEVFIMQGEISLLRSELKRKETALETERLDHCAAIEAVEKKGKEKVAKQAAEAEVKLKEKGMIVDKLQDELHFKKREVEELLSRCHHLEQQPQTLASSQTPGAATRKGRKEGASFPRLPDSSILSRFDFSRGPAKVSSVEVQTESFQSQSTRRRRLNVPLPRGQACRTRSAAYLLSCCSLPTLPNTPPATPNARCSSTGWGISSELSHLISQTLTQSDDNLEEKLVALATKVLREAHTTITEERTEDCRVASTQDGPTDWYDSQVGPALQILSCYSSPSQLEALHALSSHLSPLYVKGVMVNRRMYPMILEVTEKIVKRIDSNMDKSICDKLLNTLSDWCASTESRSEVEALVRVAAALSPHCHLCSPSGSCLVGKLCKKVKKFCVAELATLKTLLDWTWVVLKIPSPWLFSACSCSSQLLGTFLWHVYQVVEASESLTDINRRKVYRVLVSCVQVLHHWSVVDLDWWEKVAPFPQYPALMATIAAKAKDIHFDRETVDLLCDLYEFEEGTFDGC